MWGRSTGWVRTDSDFEIKVVMKVITLFYSTETGRGLEIKVELGFV